MHVYLFIIFLVLENIRIRVLYHSTLLTIVNIFEKYNIHLWRLISAASQINEQFDRQF